MKMRHPANIASSPLERWVGRDGEYNPLPSVGWQRHRSVLPPEGRRLDPQAVDFQNLIVTFLMKRGDEKKRKRVCMISKRI